MTIFGQVEFTTPGSFTWTAPAGVTEVSVVCVGGGGGGSFRQSRNGSNGGGGGGLGWKNNIPVTPGQTYSVEVGSGGARDTNSGDNSNAETGGDSYFIDLGTVSGRGGQGARDGYNTAAGGVFTGDGGGNGGTGGRGDSNDAGAGGGAGGYSGNGGRGADREQSGSNGSGGGGGGGGAGESNDAGGGGGGVGIYGQGPNGFGGRNSPFGGNGEGGSGGSYGKSGANGDGYYWPGSTAYGGDFGGGGGGAENNSNEHGDGGGGAVRIIWGEGRAFPSTNTGDYADSDFKVTITNPGGSGTHSFKKLNINSEDKYFYFKNQNFPSELSNGASYLYSDGTGEIVGISDGDILYPSFDSPTEISLRDDEGDLLDFTGGVDGSVVLNRPRVFNNILNIGSTTPSNQAVKYFTTSTPLDGLVSGETYFLKNIQADFVGAETLYELANVVSSSGQQLFTSTGNWTAPAGVTEVSVVAIGGGGGGSEGNGGSGGGGAGGLGWRSSIPVVPGESYPVVVGSGGSRDNSNSADFSNAAPGGDSYFINRKVVGGFGGQPSGANNNRTSHRTGGAGGSFVGDGGGIGGAGGTVTSNSDAGGGGGTGGYSGNGGAGGNQNSVGSSGLGGGGGGGGAGGSADAAGGGGGVGVFGQGSSGNGGSYGGGNGGGGQGGSGGDNGTNGDASRGDGGSYGGGGGGADNTGTENGLGRPGAVRIIWGSGRKYPSTNTGDV